MIDRRTVILLTKMAIYDKHHGEKDRRINGFFRSDFVYRRNMWARAAAAAGCLLVLAAYWLNQLVSGAADLLSVDWRKAGTDAGMWLLTVMVVYTLISTVLATVEYQSSQRRLERYYGYIRQLERLREMQQSSIGETQEEE